MNSRERMMRAVSLRLALFLLLAFAGSFAQAQVIGRVLIAVGEVTASRAGQAVNLGTGSAVENGDTIRVGPASNAQLRFNDEGIVALRPQTVFRIEEYNYAGRQDGAEKAAFNLIEGGMRTITGLIGKLNRGNYMVRTPTSTIGIRGTNYNLVQCDASCVNKDGSRPPPGTYGGVYDGSIGVTNRSGEKTFGAEEFFYVASPATPPQALIAPPSFLQDRLEGTSRRPNQTSSTTAETPGQSGAGADARGQTATSEPLTTPFTPVYVATEQKTASGASSLVPGVTGFIAFYSSGSIGVNIGNCGSGGTCSGIGFNNGELRGDATESSFSNNQLLSYSGSGFSGAIGSASVVDAGTASIGGHQYGWGRWVGGFSVTDSNGSFSGATAKSGVLFAFTNDPNAGTNNSLPGSGTVNYNVLVGGPSPVDTTGNTGTITSMSGVMNFTTRTLTYNMGLSINIPSQGLASMAMAGGGTIAAGKTSLDGGTLIGTCTGAGCVNTGVNGTIGLLDAAFGSNAQAMVVNGMLANAVKDTTNGAGTPRSVLFLNLLKCSTC
jgi:hypothetical protein